MTQDITNIVEEVKQKQEGDEKVFLHFLQAFDIDTLNQLYFIFNGGGSVRNPMQMLQLFIMPLSALSGLIIVFMNPTFERLGVPDNYIFFETVIGIILALYGAFNIFKIRWVSKEVQLAKLSHKVVTKQKTLSMIAFVLEKKYEMLSDAS